MGVHVATYQVVVCDTFWHTWVPQYKDTNNRNSTGELVSPSTDSTYAHAAIPQMIYQINAINTAAKESHTTPEYFCVIAAAIDRHTPANGMRLHTLCIGT